MCSGLSRRFAAGNFDWFTCLTRISIFVLILVLGIIESASAQSGPSKSFDFALIGDYPYTPRDQASMPFLMDALRDEDSIEFIIHLGDIHSPVETECSEASFRERRRVLLGTGHPLVLTPGDNDWADCKGDPAERIETMRRVFYSDPPQAAGERGFPLRAQSKSGEFSEIVENVLWERDGVLFATLHLIAPDPRRIVDPAAEIRERLIQAGEAWLDEVFRVAGERDSRGIFLATQISLWQVSANPQWLNLLYPDLLEPYSSFANFQEELIGHVRRYGGPVVLANGDSHFFRVDKPLFDENLETIQTFTRVEGFGSPQGHWVRVRVEPARPEVFSFRQEWVPENIYTLVSREERQDGFEPEGFGWILYLVRILQTVPKLLALVGLFTVARWGLRGFRRYRAASHEA